MTPEEQQQLLSSLARLDAESGTLAPLEAERILISVLGPLLEEERYKLSHTPRSREGGIDLLAIKSATSDSITDKIAVEFKFYKPGRAVGVEQVRQLIGSALLNEAERALLLVNTRFSRAAWDLVGRDLPFKVELIDLDSLREWVTQSGPQDEDVASEVSQILTAVSSSLALLVAKNPRALDHMEWRNLEQVMAEVFEGIGFDVELMAGTKDGGKDIVLRVRGEKSEYFVQIKHWRSRHRVGSSHVTDFLNVIVREGKEGGLFLSTYGYAMNAFEQLSEIDRQRVRFGQEEKIVALCRTYRKAKSGIWSPPHHLPELLYEETL